MGYQVKFAEQNLHDYCKILNVSRAILPVRENFSKTIPSMNGSYFTGFKYGEREIVLEIAIIPDKENSYIEKVNKLASILDVKNPSRLIISDEPYKYYYAVLDNSTSLTKAFATGTAQLTFICHDPIARGFYWDTYSPDSNGIFTFNNYGTAETYPIFEVDFNNNACFVQITNPKGQTVLVGAPKKATEQNIAITNTIINDECNSSATFTSLAESLLDSNRVVTGSYGIGLNGNGVICTNYGNGQEGKWTGTAFKRNLSNVLGDFEVTFDITFSSKGDNWTAPPPSPPPAPPTPEPVPPNKPAEPQQPSNPPVVSLGTYKVVNCGGLYINREPNTKYPLYAMAPNTLIYPTEISGNWAKHTHSNKWNTYTGWSSMKYLQKVSDSGRSIAKNINNSRAYADEQIGIIEMYGYDQNGAKLFKAEISDTNEFYEYVDPKIYIGNELVLHDNKNAPSPRTVEIKDDDGNVTETQEVASGVFGDFNDFVGQVTIRRESNSSGVQMWSCSISKIENGKIVKTIKTSNNLSNSSFPKGNLNYLGFYIGKFGTNDEVSEVGITNIKVTRLNTKTDEVVNGNAQLFEAGDHLQIDFQNGTVILNNNSLMNQLDIASDFFTIPVGRSQVVFKSDDKNAAVSCAMQDRFI